MNTTAIEVGKTVLYGNTFAPAHETILAVGISWAALPAKERKATRTIEYWKTEEELAARTYVKFTHHGKVWYSDMCGFAATRYETHEAMIAAYARKAS